MKQLKNLCENTKNLVKPLIDYLDQYYVYNDEQSLLEQKIIYGDSLSYVKIDASDEKLTITYSNYMAIVFVKNNYPFAKTSENSITLDYSRPLPYIMLYVTFDKCLDI